MPITEASGNVAASKLVIEPVPQPISRILLGWYIGAGNGY